MTVIPTISWGNTQTFEFCFDGVEQGSIVAIGMIGCKPSKFGFMHGYNAMLEKIKPSKIVCVGQPFPEMKGNIIVVDYNNYENAIKENNTNLKKIEGIDSFYKSTQEIYGWDFLCWDDDQIDGLTYLPSENKLTVRICSRKENLKYLDRNVIMSFG